MKLWGVLFSITHPLALSNKDLYERQVAIPDIGLLKWKGNCPELISMHHSSWGPQCCMDSTGYGRWPWPGTTLKPVSVTSEGNGFQKLDHPIGLQYQLTKLSWLSCWSSLFSFLHRPLSKPWALSTFKLVKLSEVPGGMLGSQCLHYFRFILHEVFIYLCEQPRPLRTLFCCLRIC